MNRLRSALLICVAAAACGDSSGPDLPDLRGLYDLTIRFVLTDVTTNEPQSVLCPGNIDITSQNGAAFAGSFAIVSTSVTPCAQLAGSVSGDVAAGHQLTFHMMMANEPNEVAWMTGCRTSSGNGDEFLGALNTGTITASLSAGIRCPAPLGKFKDYSFQAHVVAVPM